VAHTGLFAIETLIVGGGLVPVHVDREADIAVEFGEVGQTVGIRGRDQPQDRFAHVLENLAATGAVEAGEVVGACPLRAKGLASLIARAFWVSGKGGRLVTGAKSVPL